jgi:hypothetical protein
VSVTEVTQVTLWRKKGLGRPKTSEFVEERFHSAETWPMGHRAPNAAQSEGHEIQWPVSESVADFVPTPQMTSKD